MITKMLEIGGSKVSIDKNGSPRKTVEYYGMSTDEKPIDGVANADIFYEMDKTKSEDGYMKHKVYMFDEDSKTWLEQ